MKLNDYLQQINKLEKELISFIEKISIIIASQNFLSKEADKYIEMLSDETLSYEYKNNDVVPRLNEIKMRTISEIKRMSILENEIITIQNNILKLKQQYETEGVDND